MRLNLLEPNAHYDNAHGRPAALEADPNGSHLFRYNIEEETAVPEGKTKPEKVGWQCREIRVWCKPTADNLKREIIRSVVSESEECALINKYNMSMMQMTDDEQAVANYLEFLQFTLDVDALLSTTLSN